MRLCLALVLLAGPAAAATPPAKHAPAAKAASPAQPELVVRIPGPVDPADTGFAVLTCKLTPARIPTGCTLAEQSVPGIGGRALALAGKLPPVPAVLPNGQAIGASVKIRINGTAAGGAQAPASNAPTLLVRLPGPPDPSDNGSALLGCKLDANRKISACKVVSETQKGLGQRAVARIPDLPTPPASPMAQPGASVMVRMLGTGAPGPAPTVGALRP